MLRVYFKMRARESFLRHNFIFQLTFDFILSNKIYATTFFQQFSVNFPTNNMLHKLNLNLSYIFFLQHCSSFEIQYNFFFSFSCCMLLSGRRYIYSLTYSGNQKIPINSPAVRYAKTINYKCTNSRWNIDKKK